MVVSQGTVHTQLATHDARDPSYSLFPAYRCGLVRTLMTASATSLRTAAVRQALGSQVI